MIAIIALFVLIFRHYEENADLERNRISTLIWVVAAALGGLYLASKIPSQTLLLLMGVVSLFLSGKAWKKSKSLSLRKRSLWSGIALVPISGWILFLLRFPHLHAIDAYAARLQGEKEGEHSGLSLTSKAERAARRRDR